MNVHFTLLLSMNYSDGSGESSAARSTSLLLGSGHPQLLCPGNCSGVILNPGKAKAKICHGMDPFYLWVEGIPALHFFQPVLAQLQFSWWCSRLVWLTMFISQTVAGLWGKNSTESGPEQLLMVDETKPWVLLPVSALFQPHDSILPTTEPKPREMGNEISCLWAALINIYKNTRASSQEQKSNWDILTQISTINY